MVNTVADNIDTQQLLRRRISLIISSSTDEYDALQCAAFLTSFHN